VDVLELNDLSKRYGKMQVLRGLSLRVRAGEVYGFLGRNGAGKSTAIRIAMGITKPCAGEVRLFGEAMVAHSQVRLRQRVGYVSQEQNFYPWMTPAHSR
jgi:ABC-2 type transport system ATP-binding protein